MLTLCRDFSTPHESTVKRERDLIFVISICARPEDRPGSKRWPSRGRIPNAAAGQPPITLDVVRVTLERRRFFQTPNRTHPLCSDTTVLAVATAHTTHHRPPRPPATGHLATWPPTPACSASPPPAQLLRPCRPWPGEATYAYSQRRITGPLRSICDQALGPRNIHRLPQSGCTSSLLRPNDISSSHSILPS